MQNRTPQIEVVCIEQGRRPAWAVLSEGRQAVVVTKLDAAVRIAQELSSHPGVVARGDQDGESR